ESWGSGWLRKDGVGLRLQRNVRLARGGLRLQSENHADQKRWNAASKHFRASFGHRGMFSRRSPRCLCDLRGQRLLRILTAECAEVRPSSRSRPMILSERAAEKNIIGGTRLKFQRAANFHMQSRRPFDGVGQTHAANGNRE